MIRYIITLVLSGLSFIMLWSFFLKQCTNNENLVNRVMSYSDEKELGDQIYQTQILQGENGILVRDPYLDSIMQIITHRLTDHLTDSHYDYSVEILANPEVNAFTIPGGRIFFYSNMIADIDSTEEFAAILAHEMGHNENRDVVRRLIQNFGQNALISMSPNVLTSAATQLTSLSFAREQEDQADHFAYKLMVKSGIHPRYFAQVMENFEVMEDGNAPPEILSDHPNSARRKEEAINYPVPEDFEEVPIDVDWPAFQQRLDTILSTYMEQLQNMEIEIR